MDQRERINRTLINEGFFYGLEKVRRELPADKLLALVKLAYRITNKKVQEGKKEVVHLQMALNQMEAECIRGTARTSVGGNITADARALMSACMRLDGWTLSLLETTYSLDNGVLTPETGHKLINQSANFRQLWEARGKKGGDYNVMGNQPEFFEAGDIVFGDGSKARY